MSKHFQYLVDDQAGEFFDKIAERATGIEPTGPDLSQPELGDLSFAKFAMEVDDDLEELLEDAGPGFEGGATKLAMAYFDEVALHIPMTDAEAESLFDKCAAAGIEADVESMRGWLVENEAPQGALDELAKVASELVADAAMEKAASAGARASGLIGAAEGGLSHIGTKIKGWFQGRRMRSLGKKQRGVKADLKKTRAQQAALAAKVPVAGTGIVSSMRRGYRQSRGQSLAAREKELVGKVHEGKGNVQEAVKAHHKTKTEAAKIRGQEPPKPPKFVSSPSTGASEAAKAAEGGAAAGGAAAAGAAHWSKIPEHLKSAYKKYLDGTPLSADEKAAFAKAGIGGLVGIVGLDVVT